MKEYKKIRRMDFAMLDGIDIETQNAILRDYIRSLETGIIAMQFCCDSLIDATSHSSKQRDELIKMNEELIELFHKKTGEDKEQEGNHES